jgi:hypothetical protein
MRDKLNPRLARDTIANELNPPQCPGPLACGQDSPMQHPYLTRRTILAAAGAAIALAASGEPARAQARFDASYTASVARIAIGSVTVTGEFADAQYTMSMNGRAKGVLRVLASGEGVLTARGVIRDGRPVPASYESKTTSDDDTLDVKMIFNGGNVTELSASPPPPSEDRVPLSEAHRQNVLDPLTALLIPVGDGGDGLGESACQRTLAIFDGRRRYDLKLTFKRSERVKADKGYAGPVAVCAVTFQPIAGHRPSSPMVKYLGDGREIEIALAPIAGTRLLAPFRLSVANMLGNLVVQANRFESLPFAPVRASMTEEQKPQ